MNAIAIRTHPLGTTPSSNDRALRLVSSRSDGSSSATMIERTAEPAWAPRVRGELARLLDLPRGWDGYDAEPLGRSAAQDALTFLDTALGVTTQLPVMVPIHGGIQLEWHTRSVEIEIELRPGSWRGYISEAGEEWEGDVHAEPERLRAVLQRVAAAPSA